MLRGGGLYKNGNFVLELLAKNHDLWVKMVIGMGAYPDVAEDIVQSMYLRIHKYVKDEKKIMYKDDEVNRFFVYVTLKNMYLSHKKSKYLFFEIRDDDMDVVDEGNTLEMEEAFIRIVNRIDEEINSWHSYDKILSQKYLKTDYSLRDISKGAGISLTSLFHSMKTNKRILIEKFGEDWQDFKNGDYDLV